MKIVFLILNWLFGVLFLLTGLLSFVDSLLVGLCFITMSFLLLPPVRNFVYSKTQKELPVKVRAITIVFLFVASSVFIGQVQEKKEQELAAQQAREQLEKEAKLQQENLEYYNKHRNEILAQAKNAISKKDYQLAISQLSKYLISGDDELLLLNSKAKNALVEKEKVKQTEDLLSKLKAIPVSEFEQNKNLYQQLVDIHPNNDKYKDKLAHYSAKIEEEKQAQIVAKERKQIIERQFSPWDGSHNNLERLIKKAMNDPDSYEHDETVYWDKGDYLIVRTTYRGKNAFGGVVRNFVKAKVSLNGDILQILDQT